MHNQLQSQVANQYSQQKEQKTFELKAFIGKGGIQAEESTVLNKLRIGIKLDNQVACQIMVNICVSEQRDSNNLPIMFFTPDPRKYIHVLNVGKPGMQQKIDLSSIQFERDVIQSYQLDKSHGYYFPMIIAINYTEGERKVSFLTYCVFTKNAQNLVNGVKVERQMIIINNIPFLLKQIFGSETSTGSPSKTAVGEVEKVDDCVICLDEKSDTIIMPCGHLTVCKACGQQLHIKR